LGSLAFGVVEFSVLELVDLVWTAKGKAFSEKRRQVGKFKKFFHGENDVKMILFDLLSLGLSPLAGGAGAAMSAPQGALRMKKRCCHSR
jgi:hypothetical protein